MSENPEWGLIRLLDKMKKSAYFTNGFLRSVEILILCVIYIPSTYLQLLRIMLLGLVHDVAPLIWCKTVMESEM